MDGSGPGQREMQSPPVSTMCRRPGCAFYAHSLFDGMCSKCYKDVNEQMSSSCNSPGSSAAPTSPASNSPVTANVSCQTSSATTNSGASTANSSNIISNTVETDSDNTSDVSADMPAVKDLVATTPASANEKSAESTSPPDADTSNSAKDKLKKKRCDVCKKRVGLTGFDCRCGGHYCSLHRYSDTHSCGFDYRELAQTEIRKQNPVVAAEKVKKI